jgi:hypothetical protein
MYAELEWEGEGGTTITIKGPPGKPLPEVIDQAQAMFDQAEQAVRQPTPIKLGAPPHVLCPDCGHFAAHHFGYPGRRSTDLTCAHMTFPPFTKTTYSGIPQRCTCTRPAGDII